MAGKLDENLAVAFEELLGRPGGQENPIQAFIEQHTAFMLTPGLLNHGLQFNSVISKFPIGGRSADYAYLTKSSDEWKLILVELEDSHKKLFLPSSKHVGFTAEMNDAIAQVDVWRDYWKEQSKAVIESLDPLLVPQRRNPVSLECVLIIGRSAEKEHDAAKSKRLAALRADKRIHVMTYDTVLRAYRRGHETPKAILTRTVNGYRLRSAEGMPANIFAYVYPEHLTLSPEAEAALRADGYAMDAWFRNELLTVNQKWPMNEAWRLAEDSGAHPSMVRLLKSAKDRRAGESASD